MRTLRQLPSRFFPSGRKLQHSKESTEEKVNPEEVSVLLPDDIIFEVLSRLPVKSLCRFRCVSKGWRSLISDPAFAAAQSSNAARPLVVGVFGSFGEPLFGSFGAPCELSCYHLRVMDTADGSVIKEVKDVSTDLRFENLRPTRLHLIFVDEGIYGCKLIDPATGRVTVNAPLVDDQEPDDLASPIQCCLNIFGRAAPSGAYKIVRVRGEFHFLSPPDKRQSIEVAMLGDDPAAFNDQPTWRQRTATPFQVSLSCTATVNGMVYFMHDDAPTRANGAGYRAPPNWNRIAVFDLESEEWKTVIDGPPVVACPQGQEGMEWKVASLAVLKGTLSVVHIAALNSYHPYGYVNIWRLVDSVWVKECTIQMPQSCCFLKPLEILEDGSVMMAANFETGNGFNIEDFRSAIQLYNRSAEAVIDVMDMAPGFIGNLTVYTGSLLP
jgi:hypothetical protein